MPEGRAGGRKTWRSLRESGCKGAFSQGGVKKPRRECGSLSAPHLSHQGSQPHSTSGKEPACQFRLEVRDTSSIPGSGRSPGGGHGNPLQYSCLENPMDRGDWRAAVHRVAYSRTWIKGLSIHAAPHATPTEVLKLPVSVSSSEKWNNNTHLASLWGFHKTMYVISLCQHIIEPQGMRSCYRQ